MKWIKNKILLHPLILYVKRAKSVHIVKSKNLLNVHSKMAQFIFLRISGLLYNRIIHFYDKEYTDSLIANLVVL